MILMMSWSTCNIPRDNSEYTIPILYNIFCLAPVLDNQHLRYTILMATRLVGGLNISNLENDNQK